MIDLSDIDDRLSAYSEMLSGIYDGNIRIYLDEDNINVSAQDNIIYQGTIQAGAEETILNLVVIDTNKPENVVQTYPKIETHVACLTSLIEDDLNNSIITNGMAHELAVRYEELNMFYGLEAITHSNSELISDSEVLKELVTSCQDYLPVDFIGIYIPSEKKEIIQSDYLSDYDIEKITSFIKNNIIKNLKNNQKTLVVNHNKITDYLKDIKIKYKFIISPIISIDRNIIGILALINKLNKPDFTNSDRKLSDVLASEASNILARKRDELTGLLNKQGFDTSLSEFLENTFDMRTPSYVAQINIDQFKIINDTAGIKAGDKLLQQISSILQLAHGHDYILSRTSSDIFNILIDKTEVDIELLINDIKKSLLDFTFIHNKKYFDIKTTIGIVKINQQRRNLIDIQKALDFACKKGKSKGGNRIEFYNEEDQGLIDHVKLTDGVKLVKNALQDNNVILYAQEISAVNKDLHSEYHYEVLVRIKENNKIIPPGLFIPAAEEYNMMDALDKKVLEIAVEQLQIWNHHCSEEIILSINISGKSISSEEFLDFAYKRIIESNIPARQICFELTETSAVENLTLALKFIEKMKAIGCSFALDDFGTGMSSFNYLKNIPVDYLKIDGCFIKDISSNRIDNAMVQSVNNIAHEMGLKTIAEYVENKEIIDHLSKIGIDYLQGYGVHKPEPLENLIKISRHSDVNFG